MPASWKQGEEKHAQLLHAAAGCERFRSVRLFHYAERFSEERQQQFSATTFLLDADDKTVYVAFRGTDNTLVGWREDFNMSFQSEVPSQTDAAAYLREILTMGFSNVLVGGHSKGGNLAVFSAVHAPRHMVQRIQAVYNNDGPGFANHLLETASFWYLKDRIHTFVPQDSVIGMLLEHDEDYQVVYSRQKGLAAAQPLFVVRAGERLLLCAGHQFHQPYSGQFPAGVDHGYDTGRTGTAHRHPVPAAQPH